MRTYFWAHIQRSSYCLPHMMKSRENSILCLLIGALIPLCGPYPHDLIQTSLPPKGPTSRCHHIGYLGFRHINAGVAHICRNNTVKCQSLVATIETSWPANPTHTLSDPFRKDWLTPAALFHSPTGESPPFQHFTGEETRVQRVISLANYYIESRLRIHTTQLARHQRFILSILSS